MTDASTPPCQPTSIRAEAVNAALLLFGVWLAPNHAGAARSLERAGYSGPAAQQLAYRARTRFVRASAAFDRKLAQAQRHRRVVRVHRHHGSRRVTARRTAGASSPPATADPDPESQTASGEP